MPGAESTMFGPALGIANLSIRIGALVLGIGVARC
jgi:hypothetical protein